MRPALPLLALLFAATASAEPVPSSVLSADLDGDGSPERVSAFVVAHRGFLLVEVGDARVTSPVYAMWKVAAGDVDGDGRAELLLGIWSTRHRHDEPDPHRAVWVVGWRGGDLQEVWRGSALSMPLIDFLVADLDGDGRAELLALERSAEGACRANAYEYNGFGFSGVARAVLPCDRLGVADSPGTVQSAGRSFAPRLVGKTLTLSEAP